MLTFTIFSVVHFVVLGIILIKLLKKKNVGNAIEPFNFKTQESFQKDVR